MTWDSSIASGCCEIAAYFELAHGIAQTAKKLSGGRENRSSPSAFSKRLLLADLLQSGAFTSLL